MNSELYQWLVQAEEAIIRMIFGVFRMLTVEMWKWLYHFIVDTLGPVTVRLFRVVGLSSLWITIVFAPVLLKLPFWMNLIWAGISVSGSMWGLQRIVIKRRTSLVKTSNTEE